MLANVAELGAVPRAFSNPPFDMVMAHTSWLYPGNSDRPLSIVCTNPLSGFWIRLLGISVILLSGIGLWREVNGLQNRR